MADAHPKFDVSLVTPDGPVYPGRGRDADRPRRRPARSACWPAMRRSSRRSRPARRASTSAATRSLEFATGPGFFKVETDTALALVDDAVNVKEIDDARATAQLEAAKAELEKIDAGRVDRRPLAARAAHPARREPARRLRSHDRLTAAHCPSV